MRILAKKGHPITAKLLVQEIAYLESCVGLLGILGRNFPGDRLGEAATAAGDGIKTVLELLTAPAPVKLVTK